MTERPIFTFGDCELDPRAWRLERAGRHVQVEPKGLEVLAMLVERAGEVVTKNEILDGVWREAVVTENAMVRVIANLRVALGDDAKEPKYIETVHTRGYRFVAPVVRRNATQAATPATAAAPPPERATRRRRVLAVAASVLLVGAAVAAVVAVRGRRAPGAGGAAAGAGVPSIAVLPLENLGPRDEQYFADGMTDAITTQLAKVEALKVIARSAAMPYRERRPPLPQVGRELGVANVVEGSALLAGDHVRVTAHLVDCATSRELWAESYEGELADVLALQARIARAIAREIRARVTAEEERLMTSRQTVDPAAYTEYLVGLSLRDRIADTHRDMVPQARAMIERFRTVTVLEPGWGEAHGQLAEAYRTLGGTSDDLEERLRSLDLARRSAERALELDPTVVSAHMAMARVLFTNGDWEGCEREYREAIRLQPNSADWRFGVHLMYAGRFDEAHERLRHSQERWPNTPWIPFDIGVLCLCEGNVDAAQAQVEDLRERFHDEDLAALLEAKVLGRLGRWAEAADLLDRHRGALVVNWASTFLTTLSHAAARAGQPERARRAVRDLEALGGRIDLSTAYALGGAAGVRQTMQERSGPRDYSLYQLRCSPEYADLMRIPEVAHILRQAFPPDSSQVP
ncbi:MAG: winged helix-turn-helix domain-containing tetratricopeptide repeat protein [Acidobacteriota bacterium]